MSGSLLVAGTTSDAGKSVVTTGICRALSRRGLSVAPFKAQNMSNNSMVTEDGAEIGRAQWVQALAARAAPESAMNPVLLKPGSDRRSHVVLHGQPAGRLDAMEFAGARRHLAQAAHAAFDDLRRRFDVVVCEGAGSPTEVNLRPWDYVNMGLARHAQAPTVVVGDIDRGGVFAALFGTVALLEPADQALVAGFVVNKFRGDSGLLRPALEALQTMTGRPVLGVLPWQPGLWLDSEDAVDVGDRAATAEGAHLRVGVVRLPRISNFTDIDALGAEPAVEVRFVAEPRGLDDVDVVVLPGTRSTLADLAWLRERELDRRIGEHVFAGRPVLGICGGAQMLGTRITDPTGVEGEAGADVPGLGLLDARTEFSADKVLGTPTGQELGVPVSGYEIHHGRMRRGAGAEPFVGGARSGAVMATMWHGSLEGDAFRAAWLREAARAAGRSGFEPDPRLCFADARQRRIDLLADMVEEHLDMRMLLHLVEHGAPDALPFLPPGAPPGLGSGLAT